MRRFQSFILVLFLTVTLGLAAPAQANLIGIDAYGDADGTLLAVSLAGNSRGAVAVSGTGNATSDGLCAFHGWCPGIAASGIGEARAPPGTGLRASGCDLVDICAGQDDDPSAPVPLAARWRFDAQDRLDDDTTADSSGNGNTGYVFGPTPTPGRRGNAYQFHGDGSYIWVDAQPSVNILGDLTFAAWLAPDTLGLHFVINKWTPGEDPSTNRPYNVLLHEGRIAYRHEHGYGEDVSVTTDDAYVFPGQWTHVAVVRKASALTLTFYVNGQPVESHAYAANPDGGERTTLWLGHEDWQDQSDFRGRMDEVHLFASALSPAQVEALYLSG